MKKRFLVLGSALLAAGFSLLVWADPVQIDITRGLQKYNLGVSPFVTTKESDAISRNTRDTVLQDLKFSKLFNLVESGPQVRGRNEVAQWRGIGSDAVLSANVRRGGNGRIEIQSALYDVSSLKDVLDIRPTTDSADARFLGHQISNEVLKYFTGRPGIFNSRIAFINDATGRKELYVADYDGHNLKRLTNDNSIVILPRISPDGSKIIFTSYLRGNPDLFIINSDGTGRKKLSAKAGLNVSPSWAPNSQELAVTLSLDGPPNIYLMDLQGTIKRRLTDGQGADTAPCFSPDGRQIVFTSDRAGAPHIFICNVDGTGLRRLTTVGHCDSAAWSPDGQTIVYVKSETGNKFDLYSIEVLTGVERRLTWANGNSENPAWSPDGRFIIFVTNRRGKSELFSMTADGSDQAPLFTNSGQSYTPHWSR